MKAWTKRRGHIFSLPTLLLCVSFSILKPLNPLKIQINPNYPISLTNLFCRYSIVDFRQRPDNSKDKECNATTLLVTSLKYGTVHYSGV